MTDSTTCTGWLKKINLSEAAIDPTKSSTHLKLKESMPAFSSTTISRNVLSGSQGRSIMLLMLSLGILTSAMQN
jgi:hypothetical protein